MIGMKMAVQSQLKPGLRTVLVEKDRPQSQWLITLACITQMDREFSPVERTV